METRQDKIRRYHLETAHVRGMLTGRALNRENQPAPFKAYRKVPVVPLVEHPKYPEVALQDVLDSSLATDDLTVALSGICHLSGGVTEARTYADGSVFHLRASPSAGALYPIELYAVLQNVPSLSDGLYHYSPFDHSLNVLRSGMVLDDVGSEPAVRFVLTSMYHRSAWKYGQRAYRYCLLDAGHLAENTLLASKLYGLPAHIDYDFNDAKLAEFLGIHPDFEGTLVQVNALGCGPGNSVSLDCPLMTDEMPAFSLSSLKAQAPEVVEAHEATASFARCPERECVEETGAVALPPALVRAPLAQVIMERRSRRNFIVGGDPSGKLSDILGLLCQDTPPPCRSAVQVGFLAGPHSGMEPGYYRLNRADYSVTQLVAGDLLPQSMRACLDQGWLENAAMHMVFTADLNSLIATCGPRAYRYAHLEAGRLGQLVYLGATARNLGACGIGAFFDDEAATALSLPAGHSLLYLVAIGPVRK